jgi:hypothetical protein
MISLPTFIIVTDKHTEKDVYINPTHIVCIRPSRNDWKVVFCNEIHITVDERGLKTITDHSEILLSKIK